MAVIFCEAKENRIFVLYLFYTLTMALNASKRGFIAK